MQLQAVLNKQDGTYLEMTGIISLSLNLIPVDHEGNTAYAIIGYPSPGAGYKLAMYNDEQKAHDEFDKLIEANKNQPGAIYEIVSDFTQVVKAEKAPADDTVQENGAVELTEEQKEIIAEDAEPCVGENCEDCDECTCENHEETTEVVGGVELPVEETETEETPADGPVFG